MFGWTNPQGHPSQPCSHPVFGILSASMTAAQNLSCKPSCDFTRHWH
jgi:hypothetical protein